MSEIYQFSRSFMAFAILRASFLLFFARNLLEFIYLLSSLDAVGRQTKRVPQRDIGIVVYTRIAFFCFIPLSLRTKHLL
jgi:hypothetical protein